MADTQTERAYQKQPTIFQNKKRVLLGNTGKEKLPRYYKNIGLGFKTPKEFKSQRFKDHSAFHPSKGKIQDAVALKHIAFLKRP